MENFKSLFKIRNIPSLFITSIPRRYGLGWHQHWCWHYRVRLCLLWATLSSVQRSWEHRSSWSVFAHPCLFERVTWAHLPAQQRRWLPEVKAGTGILLLLLLKAPRWGNIKYRTSQKRGLGEKRASTVGELWKGWGTAVTTNPSLLLVLTLKLFRASQCGRKYSQDLSWERVIISNSWIAREAPGVALRVGLPLGCSQWQLSRVKRALFCWSWLLMGGQLLNSCTQPDVTRAGNIQEHGHSLKEGSLLCNVTKQFFLTSNGKS